MFLLEGRLSRYMRELSPFIYPVSAPVGDIEMRQGQMPQGAHPDDLKDGWKPFTLDMPWTMPDSKEFVLFRFKVTVPQEMDGYRVMLRCRTNKTGEFWLNPQFLLYVNGDTRQAFDTNHTEALLCGAGCGGKTFDIVLSAFGGFNDVRNAPDPVPVMLFTDIAAIDDGVNALVHDLRIPQALLRTYSKDSYEYKRLIETVNETLNVIDILEPGSAEFYKSVADARQFINANLYENPTLTVDATVSCLGQTHIDVAWLWRFCHTREKAARSFATVIGLMEEYPEYKFTMSQPQLFEFVKQDYPYLYEKIKKYVKEGRFEIEGGMWVEADTNVPSGESLVRQFLYGTRFNEKEFGVINNMLWMPDVFGYSAALPQIMQKCGLSYFYTTKLASNEVNQIPNHTFKWRGIDGSEVLTMLMTYAGSYNGAAHPADFIGAWNRYKNKDINNDIMVTYGFGDGGGGPNREMLETITRFKKGLPGSPRTRFSGAIEYLDSLRDRVKNAKRLPVWTGELYYEKHRGTYSTLSKNKRFNRKAEVLFTNIEWAATLEKELFGEKYPIDELTAYWKTILINQFHDVLPGSSIKEVYEDTDIMYAELFEKGEKLYADILARIADRIKTEDNSLIVFNPLSYTHATAIYFDGGNGICLADGEYEYPVQKTHDGRSVAVIDDIPAKGWKIVKIVDSDKTFAPLNASDRFAENNYVSITLDDAGDFCSIIEKETGAQLMRRGETGKVLIYEDKPHDEDNWNLDVFYTEKKWDMPACEVKLVENGPVRSVIKVRREFKGSWLEQFVTVWTHTPRIDIENTADWNVRDVVLKADMPVNVNADHATFEIQFGHLSRVTHTNTSWEEAKFEVCGHRFADMSDNGFGLSIINDCKYGYDMLGGSLRLTMFRTTRFPNPNSDVGMHYFTYSLLPHKGGFSESPTVEQAYDLNYPATAVKAGCGGRYEGDFCFADVQSENIILETVKRAEDDNSVIVRMYDAYNMSGRCTVEFFADIMSAEECNLLEKPIGDACVNGNSLEFDFKPFEIKTFKLRFKA